MKKLKELCLANDGDGFQLYDCLLEWAAEGRTSRVCEIRLKLIQDPFAPDHVIARRIIRKVSRQAVNNQRLLMKSKLAVRFHGHNGKESP